MSTSIAAIFTARIASYREWLFILLVAGLFVWMPQVPNTDWELNVSGIIDGAAVSHNPAYVYPPWALILFLPAYAWGAVGTRVLSVVIVGGLAQRRRWSLLMFFAVILSPLFLWTMTLSSLDVIILVLALLLWEQTTRWQAISGGLALALLLLKPQVGILLALYWLWTLRRQRQRLLGTLGVAALITLPISLIGSPPLLAQWLTNILHPATGNVEYWLSNNLSLSSRFGLPVAVLVLALVFGLAHRLIRLRGVWTSDYTISSLLTVSMLVMPYASSQSAIVPIGLHPSWRVTLLQYVGVFGAYLLSAYAQADTWLILAYVVVAMWLSSRRPIPNSSMNEQVMPLKAQTT
ncbi:MAG: DUF2029 domain-containing protein [Anaerolineae bacterium]|nr:DUF2029 domain-containing protein [Anaerolineae bacterium]